MAVGDVGKISRFVRSRCVFAGGMVFLQARSGRRLGTDVGDVSWSHFHGRFTYMARGFLQAGNRGWKKRSFATESVQERFGRVPPRATRLLRRAI